MLNRFIKNIAGTIKFCIGLGLIGGILLILSLRGCSTSINKYDSTNKKTVMDDTIKLQKITNDKLKKMNKDRSIEKSAEMSKDVQVNYSNNQTEIEMKKLNINARGIIDQKSIEQKKTLDINQQSDREFELEKMRIENERALKEVEDNKKIQADRAKTNAKPITIKVERDKEELELLKMLSE